MKKIGLSNKIPDAFKDLPHFPNDQLIDDYSDGDIMIQACSNDSQVSFHAVHNLVRPFRDIVRCVGRNLVLSLLKVRKRQGI